MISITVSLLVSIFLKDFPQQFKNLTTVQFNLREMKKYKKMMWCCQNSLCNSITMLAKQTKSWSAFIFFALITKQLFNNNNVDGNFLVPLSISPLTLSNEENICRAAAYMWSL
uniref:Uncharacterized protein n=1 Tax=Octopus bimaculoides TaxID=37653 RepID=A0A0L8GGV3_OCTBM